MKKIFIIALVFVASVGVAKAQTQKLMKVNRTNGSTVEFTIDEVKNITFDDSPWVSLGYCLYGEDFIASTLYMSSEGDLCCEYYVEVQENVDQPGLYRLVNPYAPEAYPFSEYTSYDDSNHYIEINATDPDGVYINLQDTGMSWSSFGGVWVYSRAAMFLDEGYPLSEVKRVGYCGTLKDGVITFPISQLLTYLPSYYPSVYYGGNSNNNFKVDLNDKSDTLGAKNAKSVSHVKIQGGIVNIENYQLTK